MNDIDILLGEAPWLGGIWDVSLKTVELHSPQHSSTVLQELGRECKGSYKDVTLTNVKPTFILKEYSLLYGPSPVFSHSCVDCIIKCSECNSSIKTSCKLWIQVHVNLQLHAVCFNMGRLIGAISKFWGHVVCPLV